MGISHLDHSMDAGKRSLRTHPKACLLGPTGARLWADYLNMSPGFAGCIDFVHKMNIPLLFGVESGILFDSQPCKVNWKPSHLILSFESASLRFYEEKFISWNDCAVSVQTWENLSKQNRLLKLTTHSSIIQSQVTESLFTGIYKSERHGFGIQTVVMTSEPRLGEGMLLKPGEKVQFIIAAALGIHELDDIDVLNKRAEQYVTANVDEVVTSQQQQYHSWFEHAPTFHSSDELLNATWQYRWFLLRHNLADPAYGNLQYPLFYEGRSHKMSKTPFSPEGWEFSKMIPLTTPMHILDARWYNDPKYCQGIMHNMASSQDEDGLYNCVYVNEVLHSYANFMGWSAYQYYLVHRDKPSIQSMLPSLKKQVYGEAKVYGNTADKLLIEYNHKRTGKEYQPSYWYFHDYPEDCMDTEQYTPLKRVDRSVYHYLNCLGVAQLCELVGDPDASAIHALAQEIKEDITAKMWDESEGFFFDLHAESDQKALVKNIVGFYPYWAKLTGSEHENSFRYLMDERYFNTGSPFPSVSADCPAYSAEGGWQGHFIKGRNGCVWNGPTWPYTNGVVLDAIANESKRRNHELDEQFGYFFREYSWLHYAGRDLNKPYLVEHYNSQTGEAISDEVDYNHSYYIDLIIRHVVGLEITCDRIILDPIHMDLDHFDLQNIQMNGMNVRVSYQNPAISGSMDSGYRLYVDGLEVIASRQLSKLEYIF